MGFVQRLLGFEREDGVQDEVVGSSPFDEIRRYDYHGEHWKARELAKMLDYDIPKNWANFVSVINKSRDMLEGLGFKASDHILDVKDMVEVGSGAFREVEDYRLSRRGCYCIAANADPRKKGVQLAKNYFITSTRAMEIAKDNPQLSRKVRAWVKAERNWDWVSKKLKAEGIRNTFATTLSEHEVNTPAGFATCTRTITKEVMGQYPVEIRNERGVKKTRDAFSIPEMVNMMFAESLAAQMIEKNARVGVAECNFDCKAAGENTRRAIDDSLGTRIS